MTDDQNTKWKIVNLDCVASTNSYAIELARHKTAHKTVIVANSQTAGRGRNNKKWISPPDCNLYASICLIPDLRPERAAVISLLTPVSIAHTIYETTGLEAKIKWPNDILLNGKKTAGILIESSVQKNELNYIIIGIGINLNMDPEQIEGKIENGLPATSLKNESGRNIERRLFLESLIKTFEKWYGQISNSAYIIKEWKKLSDTIGRTVTCSGITGTVIDITASGSLLIRTDEQLIEKVTSGELRYL